MFNYRIERQQDDGSWSVQKFRAVDDSGAIAYGLRVRTANKCELYQSDRWLATFDGVAEASVVSDPQAHGNRNRSFVKIETEVAYFQRRALQERERGRKSGRLAGKLTHLTKAEQLDSLARAVEAAQRRLTFYDVNAVRGAGRVHASL